MAEVAEKEQSIEDLFGGLPPERTAALLIEFQKIGLTPDDPTMRLLRAMGILTAIQHEIPDKIRNLLQDHGEKHDVEAFRAVLKEELRTADVTALQNLLTETRDVAGQLAGKTGELLDSSTVAAEFRKRSLALWFLSLVVSTLTVVIAVGWTLHAQYKRELAEQQRLTAAKIQDITATKIPEFKAVAAELLQRGVTVSLYKTQDPRTKAPCKAVVFDGPVGNVYTDKDGQGVVLLP